MTITCVEYDVGANERTYGYTGKIRRFMDLAARAAHQSLFPDYPIDGVACLYLKSGWRKAPNYTFKKYKCDEATWKKVVEVSDWANNKPAPSFPRDLPTTFTLVKEEEEQELKESA